MGILAGTIPSGSSLRMASVIFSLFLGMALWGEFPDFYSVLGSGLIVLSGIKISNLKQSQIPFSALR